MELNSNFEERIVIRPEDYQWVPSPMPGVTRMMLDRVGDEVARATTIVRYEPNSKFSSHTHDGGEEFFVLDGVFRDDYGEFPKGTYVRNPIGTSHTPKIGPEGCTIFVKLFQFEKEDQEQKQIDTNTGNWTESSVEGERIMPLHHFGHERVSLVEWAPNTKLPEHQHHGGEETLVLSGKFYDEEGEYPEGSWIRNPDTSIHTPYTEQSKALLLVKTGHLR